METKDNKNIRPNQFYETELWSLFASKAEASGHSVEKLKDFCTDAETLSKKIIDSFPYYTLHDNTHTAGVCKWMYLLLGDKAKLISMEEAALLLMAACCHDLGMLIGENEETELIAQAKKEWGDWKEYFERHPSDREKLDSKEACHEVVINYVRENHHLRVEKIISSKLDFSSDFFLDWEISEEMLIAVCKSHGEKLNDLKLNTKNIDVNLCAVLLRLADALDYDSNRAPNILLRFLELDKKYLPENSDDDDAKSKEERAKSLKEWRKNRAGGFHRSHPRSMTITYRAKCYQPHIEAELNNYLKWLKEELQECYNFVDEYCKEYSGKENNPIPLILESKIKPFGYDSAEIRLMMDQNRVLELLSGEELYGEQGVFVRELLQNSIDAVLMRCECDEKFSVDDGEINIDIWTDKEDGRYCWFRIKDNGIGMDKEIVKKYFLNVARSYYNDEEGYKKDLLRQGKNVSSFKPISRFGIGILSCFMGEGKNNRMEISTKRYSFDKSKPSKPVRLDITGLNGYYYLTELSEVKKGEPMPQPPREEAAFEYMRDEGTTICLRLDLYNTSISSFRELLDKYIRFPKIKISFTDHRTAENKTYPTQQELEALLDKLNPDFDKTGEVTKHIHRMKQEDFEELKAAIPEDGWSVDWSNVKCPELVLQYRPLHKMSLSGELSGAVIKNFSNSFRMTTHSVRNNRDLFHDMRFEFDGVRYRLLVDVTILRAENGKYLNISRDELKDINSRFSVELSEDEVKLHDLLSDPSAGWLGIAYNGILCDITITPYSYLKGMLLLNGDFRPEVSIARDKIRDFPLDASFEIALLSDIGAAYFIHSKRLRSYPASEFYAFLEKHKLLSSEAESIAARHLKDMVSEAIERAEKSGWTPINYSDSYTLNIIRTAALKKSGLIIVASKNGVHFEKSDGSPGFDPEGFFPITLFADRFYAEGFGILYEESYEYRLGFNIFSPAHPFSAWLIESRALLQKDVPSVYDRIINAMVKNADPDKLTLTLNTILDQLRNLPNNPFKVPHDLRIKEGEIAFYDEQSNR